MRVAGLDLGTNTFLCLIADVDARSDGSCSIKVIRDEVRVVRLGQGLAQAEQGKKMLHPEALVRAEEAFREFAVFIRESGCQRVLATATSAARDSQNGQALIDLGRKYGIPIEIISGEKEAELTFAGSIEPSWTGTTAVIDVGGGSTEMILGTQSGILSRVSADVGSVRLTEICVTSHPISNDEISRIRERVRTALLQAKTRLDVRKIDQVIAVAGTPTTLAAMDRGQMFESEKVHGHVFSLDRLNQWIERLSKMTVTERQKLAGMEPKRADVIVAGAICVVEAIRVLGQTQATVSVRGLRYGVARWCAERKQ